MAELDERTERTLRSFTREVRDLYGENVLSVILYGSAIGPDYVPEVSDLNVLVILKEVGPEQLKKALKYVKRWRKSRISPLFLDPRYIESSLDAFPIEFLEMKEGHRLLWGEDPLEELEVSQENLRLQCEQELKGKWLKLRQVYLETEGNPKRIKKLMIASLRPFGVVLSALLRLKGFAVPPREFLEVVTQVEETFNLELGAFREVYQLKQGFRSLDRAELNGLFARYLAEVRRLAQAADTLFRAEE
jgi:predicted nucleotidyltransferase